MNWKYHISHSYILDKKKFSFTSQLYKVGVYAILNSDPSMQLNLEPKDIVEIEKTLKKDLNKGVIKDLIFTNQITVTDETGFFTQKIES